MTKLRLPRYVQALVDRGGRSRYYFRRPGFRATLPGAPYSTEFMNAHAKAYADWQAGHEAIATTIGVDRVAPGSFNALIASYYRSSEFLTLRPITQSTYRNRLEKIRQEHGEKPVAGLNRSHIKALMAKKADKPDQANRLLKTLRLLMRHALDLSIRADDPCHGIRKFKTDSTGYRTWTEDEIEQFYAKHPDGSRARLALDLLLYTGQRRQDIVRMGRQHIRGDFLVIKQSKTDTIVSIPINGRFKTMLDQIPRDRLNFIVGERGLPLTPESFTNGFCQWVKDADLPLGLSPHGLRKAVCRRLAEAGCTANQIMTISGHKNLKEVATYTQAADGMGLAKSAMATASSFRPADEQ